MTAPTGPVVYAQSWAQPTHRSHWLPRETCGAWMLKNVPAGFDPGQWWKRIVFEDGTELWQCTQGFDEARRIANALDCPMIDEGGRDLRQEVPA